MDFIIEENDPGLDAGDFFGGLLVQEEVVEIAAGFAPIPDGDLDFEYIAVKTLRFIDQNGIGDNDAGPLDVSLDIAILQQHRSAGLLSQREDRVVAEVAAIVDVPGPEGNVDGINEVVWQVEVNSRHLGIFEVLVPTEIIGETKLGCNHSPLVLAP